MLVDPYWSYEDPALPFLVNADLDPDNVTRVTVSF